MWDELIKVGYKELSEEYKYAVADKISMAMDVYGDKYGEFVEKYIIGEDEDEDHAH